MAEHQRHVQETLGRRDGIRVFDSNGFPRKPDPRSVQRILELIDLSLDDALMVGDWKWGVMAGQGAGVRTCLYLKEGPSPSR